MTDKIDQELKDKLYAVLDADISECTMKGVKKAVDGILTDIEGDVEYRLKSDLAMNLVGWVSDCAQRAVDALLAGNEAMMRRYLSCDGHYDGRSTGAYGEKQIERSHEVIHGKLWEHGPIEIRKKIVEAHRDLLVNERVLDLEDQVKSLVAQVNKANAEKQELRDRLRDYRI